VVKCRSILAVEPSVAGKAVIRSN